MSKRICLIEGHPDTSEERFGHAIANAYAQAARDAGHELRTLRVGELDFPFIRSQSEWLHETPPPDIVGAQEDIRWANHLVLVFPLWLGAMPALLKAFLEQTLRPGFAIPEGEAASPFAGLLKGRSARIFVTMGMPAFFYRAVYRAHSLKALERNILRFAGIKPIRSSVIGMVEQSERGRRRWLERAARLGGGGR